MGWSELIGERLGDYEIIAEIARGGMSRVYKARDHAGERDIAIKVMALGSDGGSDSTFARRFEHEAQAVERLDHPNIVKVYATGKTDEFVYIAMQLVQGGTYRQILQPGKPLPIAEACSYISQMARALHHAHMHYVIHRDVKPANMLIDEHDVHHMLLADFGIAKIMGQKGVTKTGTAVGTPEYMAPEQAKGEEIDQRADIYGLACVLYESLAGRPPFVGPTALSICYQHVHTRPAYIRGFNPEVPRQLAQVIEQALAKNPRDRFATAEEFANALYPFTEPTGAVIRRSVTLTPPAADLDLRATPNGFGAGLTPDMTAREPALVPPAPMILPFDQSDRGLSFSTSPVLDLSSLSAKPPITAPPVPDDATTRPTQEIVPMTSPARPRHTRPVQPGLRLKSNPVTRPRSQPLAAFSQSADDIANFSTVQTPTSKPALAVTGKRTGISDIEPRRKPLFVLLAIAIVISLITLFAISRLNGASSTARTTPIVQTQPTVTTVPATAVPTLAASATTAPSASATTQSAPTATTGTNAAAQIIRSATITYGTDLSCNSAKNVTQFPSGTTYVTMNACPGGSGGSAQGTVTIELYRGNSQIYTISKGALPCSASDGSGITDGTYTVKFLWNNQLAHQVTFTIG